MINFDLLVAGCDTRCKHCYVNGGPLPRMKGDDAVSCIERLDAIAAVLPDEAYFTLDHEPMGHPEIGRIIEAAAGTKHIRYHHHGMTTGLGLMRRDDREAVLDRYLSLGFDSFGITVHGGEALHDEIVRRKGAFAASAAFGAFVKTRGAELEVSLMVNRLFPQQREEISALLDRLRPDWIHIALPIFTPHKNGMDYETYRASVKDIEALGAWFSDLGKDGGELIEQARESSVGYAAETLQNGQDLKTLFMEPQGEKYLAVHPDCLLYMGNSGAETECLGDLRSLDPEATAARIASAPDNRDYDAFYDQSVLPETEQLIKALKGLPQETVYGDFPSVIYRGLAALHVPTRIFDLSSEQQRQ